MIKQAAKKELARRDFWEYCHLMAPDFYRDDRWHLKQLCDLLGKLYAGELLNEAGEPLKKLIINMPPQHGKSRTLINFCQWILGKDNNNRIITCSYNDDTAHDFSKFTRNGIQEDKILPDETVYSDIFPGTKIKRGDSAYDKWALEGQHFNYLGAGIGGSITGKGGTVLIVDDPIKSAEIALNESALEKIWLWYTGTFLSRVSAEGGEPLEIIVMTRWSKHDLCGRLLAGESAAQWYVISLKAFDPDRNEMLCPSMLGFDRYNFLKSTMVPEIFLANYDQLPIDVKGRLYQSFKTYTELPMDANGWVLLESIQSYTDTADEGKDYLCSIVYGNYKGEGYVLDVLYTRESMEHTEPQTADMFQRNGVTTALIESNNGGRGFARAVEKLLWDKYSSRNIHVKWFHQSENKMARILTRSNFVQQHIYFPLTWRDRWPDFYNALTTFQKEGKNTNDDAPDALTGVAEQLQTRRGLVAVRPL